MEKPRVLNLNNDGVDRETDVYIGRFNARFGYPASKWGNPFSVGKDGNREQVLEKYHKYLLNNLNLVYSLHELKGKNLVCFCSPSPCHGDILLELANKNE